MTAFRTGVTRAALAVASAVICGSLTPLPASARVDADTPGGRLVAEVAAPRTPHVLDGEVYSVTQVGRTVVLGGSFTRVRESGSPRRLVRRGLVAFDAVTGRVAPRFAPDPHGEVRVVLPAGDGRTVFVGGAFTSISGTRRARLVRIRVADGSVVGGFRPGRLTGRVKDLALARGRLWVAGAFTHVAGHPQRALATLDPATGRRTGFMHLALRGHHHRGVTQVLKVAASPDGSRLVAIGNFDTVAGRRHHQLVVLDTGGRRAVPSRFRTRFYTSPCSPRFDTTMRDVDIAPDGSWFVVGTTGAYGGPASSCDTVARFETRAAGQDVQPSWVAHTGGDTTYGVEAAPAAVYVGGHQRWWNNPFAGDRPGPGAVARRGIAALDPLNGLPLSWDPGRDGGIGVFDFLLTGQGLWVASDTTRVGRNQYKGRIARFPAGGRMLAGARAPRLPGELMVVGGAEGDPHGLHRRVFTGTSIGRATPASGGGIDWAAVRGAFTVGRTLYLAHADGRLTARSYDGTRFGTATSVSAADRLVPLCAWEDDVRRTTGMFLDRGRLYFTLAGSSRLYYRYFSPDSGVVGAQRLVAATAGPAGVDLARVSGMFVASDRFYWATPDGTLHSASWRRGAASGRPGRPLDRTWPVARASFGRLAGDGRADRGDDRSAARVLFVLST